MKDKFEQLKYRSKDLVEGVTLKSKEVMPSFWALKKAYRVVIVIVLVVVLWMLSGVFHSKPKNGNGVAEQVMVKVIDSHSSSHKKTLLLNGVTKASKIIEIKAETDGIVVDIPVVEGQFLKKGEVIARLDERNHRKQLEQAEAEYDRQLLSYKATKATFDKNLSSAISLADATTRLKAAENQLKTAKYEIEKTISNAPEDGYLDSIYVEQGDFASNVQSNKIATFLVLNPVQAIVYVPEKNIHDAQAAKDATVIFADKVELVGSIKFLSKAADENTRTYKLEITIPNDEYKILSGQTVRVKIPLMDVEAHHVPRSSVVLDMKGDVAIKTVSVEGKVKSHTVELVDEDEDGFWLTGLPESVKIITLGHQYVKEDEQVIVNDKVY